MSRAQPIICSWNQRRSGTPKPRFGRVSTAGGTHGRITSRNSRFVVVRVAVARRRLRRGQLDHAMIEKRAPRLERMRHRRAIDLHEDVVGQVVVLVPLLQARQQRAARRANLGDRLALGQRAGRAQHVARRRPPRAGSRETPCGARRTTPPARAPSSTAGPCRARAPARSRAPAPIDVAQRVDRRRRRRAPARRRTACSRRTARRRRRRSGRPSRDGARAPRRRTSESPTRRRTARRSARASVSATRTQSGVTICS